MDVWIEWLRADTIHKEQVEPPTLMIHADRGSSMASKPGAILLADLGVTTSHHRPHVSNDNPYSESRFKTLKDCPDSAERFGAWKEARYFCSTKGRSLPLSGQLQGGSPGW